MKWEELNVADASQSFYEYCTRKNVDCPPAYMQLREDLVQGFINALTSIGITKDEIKHNLYLVDLYFGVELYDLFVNKYSIDIRKASSAGFWRYLSVIVVPDLVDLRYGTDHPDRFWQKSKRIWLRVIWWYIYLSWQGSKENTVYLLKNNTTDEILQLVDRSGRGGYRVRLYREIMRKYGSVPKNQRPKGFFRKMMVLNTARVRVIEPGLFIDGEAGYVKSLCDYIL